jgi:hypothetical protein
MQVNSPDTRERKARKKGTGKEGMGRRRKESKRRDELTSDTSRVEDSEQRITEVNKEVRSLGVVFIVQQIENVVQVARNFNETPGEQPGKEE